jgi:hypothetical protein
MSSRSSGETDTMRQAAGKHGTASGRMYSVRIERSPEARIWCSVRAGIHMALSGGRTQTPLSVVTVITPAEA